MADSELFRNIKDIYSRMARAALKSGRDVGDVRLIAVTKEVAGEMVAAAVEKGLREFGESRIQAAAEKIAAVSAAVPDSVLVWHLIGHVQKNKVKSAVALFDLIHSVDSGELAWQINEQAARIGKVQRVLIQVKLSAEESKHGIGKSGVTGLLAAASSMRNLRVEGLMTIPPYLGDAELTRPYFRELREIADNARDLGFNIRELSMGMSHDFEIAIEEGATLVRVGTALFGERKKEEEA